MERIIDLDNFSHNTIQTIYQCLFQAVCEDYQEAEAHLDLQTRISKPFIIWDLINRNLIRNFTEGNVLYSTKKRGMWEVLLLYDKESNTILSFMRDTRFKELQKAKTNKHPQYIRALLTLNAELNAPIQQQCLFELTTPSNDNEQLRLLLNALCANFQEDIIGEIKNHALIVFSSDYGHITSLRAYILDTNLNPVATSDWLNVSKPVVSTQIERATTDTSASVIPTLTEKAKQRKNIKENFVALKTSKLDKKKSNE